MSKKTDSQKSRNRQRNKKKEEFFIEEYSEKRLKEFLKEDKIDQETLKKARKLLF